MLGFFTIPHNWITADGNTATERPVTNPASGRDWKAVVLEYGRHKPGCSTIRCDCGFEQIEKELHGC